MGLANLLAAGAGIRRFDSSLGGLGGCPYAPGASGNICSEDAIHMLQAMGYDTGVDMARLLAVARSCRRALATRCPARCQGRTHHGPASAHRRPSRELRKDIRMIDHLDHLVLTTSREAACVDFYTRVLGMQLGEVRRRTPPWSGALQVRQPEDQPACARAASSSPRPTCRCRARWTCASSPACRSTTSSTRLGEKQMPIEEGPVLRTGATGPNPLGLCARPRSEPDRDLGTRGLKAPFIQKGDNHETRQHIARAIAGLLPA